MQPHNQSHKQDDASVNFQLTPMIDIVFLLLIFFLCTTRFDTLEGKLLAYLPQNGVINRPLSPALETEPILLRLTRDQYNHRTRISVGSEWVANFTEAYRRIRSLYQPADQHSCDSSQNRPTVKIKAEPDVPTKDVVAALDICQKARVEKIEFAVTIHPDRLIPSH
jgi:biopolymer transport protein ExbD